MSGFVNIIESALSTITLWHGGRNVESDYSEVRSHKSGRWEHGPGLYLTTHYDTAARYAKGGGKLYKVTIRKGTNINDVEIPLEDAIEFADRRVPAARRKELIADLRAYVKRVGFLRAEALVNLCLNLNALPSARTNLLRQFLIDHGVDYAETRYGGRNETVVVVINPKIIKRVEIVKAAEVTSDGYITSAAFPE